MFILAPICSVEANVGDWKMMKRPATYDCRDTSGNLTCYVERPQQRYAPETMMPIPTTAPVYNNDYRLEPLADPFWCKSVEMGLVYQHSSDDVRSYV